jgi:hypothetical protein
MPLLLLTMRCLDLKVISCQGAGAKADPTAICIGNLTDVFHDPLAVKVHRLSDAGLLTAVCSCALPSGSAPCVGPKGSAQYNASTQQSSQHASYYRSPRNKGRPQRCLPRRRLLCEAYVALQEFGALANFRLRVIPVTTHTYT